MYVAPESKILFALANVAATSPSNDEAYETEDGELEPDLFG